MHLKCNKKVLLIECWKLGLDARSQFQAFAFLKSDMTLLDPGVWCLRLHFELITPFLHNTFWVASCYQHAFPKSPILCKDKLVEGTKRLGSDDVMSLFKNAKAWNWERASKPSFQHSISNTFLLHFNCIGLQTLGGPLSLESESSSGESNDSPSSCIVAMLEEKTHSSQAFVISHLMN